MSTALPAATAAKMAIERQNFALSALKNAVQGEQAIAAIVEQGARSAPVSAVRGANVNTSA